MAPEPGSVPDNREAIPAYAPEGIGERLLYSWEMTKMSFRVVFAAPRLLIFPAVSLVAMALVMLSFWLPLSGTATADQLSRLMGSGAAGEVDPGVWVLAFLFYFVTVLVILFFNVGLTESVLRITAGEPPSVSSGFALAARRLPQLMAWALLASVVGVLLRALENTHERGQQVVAAVLGTGWAVLTFFVVPVLVVEKVGPFRAIGRSMTTLKASWGEALVAHFSHGLIATVLMILPLIACLAVGVYISWILAIALAIVAFVLVNLIIAAAGTVLRCLLYNYATGRPLPAGVDKAMLASTFG
jgi:hypothetical protein